MSFQALVPRTRITRRREEEGRHEARKVEGCSLLSSLSDWCWSPAVESKQEQAAAILIQKRIRGMQTRASLSEIPEAGSLKLRSSSLPRERSLLQELVHQDAPTLAGRELDPQEQEMLGQIQESRRRASKGQRNLSSSDGNAPAVRGRRLDDNVTLPMNDFSIAKTQWILTLFDYLCVRVDGQGRRTTKIGEGQVCEGIIIPDTVIYRQNTIDAWYFTDSTGRLNKKQHTKEFSTSNILSVFLAKDRLHTGSSKDTAGFEGSLASDDSKEPVAYLIELSEEKKTETYRWMDRSSLELFLRSHHKPRSGILQKFVSPPSSFLSSLPLFLLFLLPLPLSSVLPLSSSRLTCPAHPLPLILLLPPPSSPLAPSFHQLLPTSSTFNVP